MWLSSHFEHAIERHPRPVLHAARTWMRLTTRPSTRFSSAQARCCGLMRYMVVQRQPVSSRRDDALAFGGKPARQPVDQVNLGADGEHRACRSLLDQRDQPLG